jgi:hypothetical protein
MRCRAALAVLATVSTLTAGFSETSAVTLVRDGGTMSVATAAFRVLTSVISVPSSRAS